MAYDREEILQLLKRIKCMRVSQFKELIDKLETLTNGLMLSDITLKDIQNTFIFCLYHYKGGLMESFGLEECPCQCYCINCEVIPEGIVSKRMVEIATYLKEENVLSNLEGDSNA